MMKRWTSLLLALCLLMGLLPAMSFYSDAATYSGTCGENVYWSLNTDTGVLTISGNGDMTDYSSSSRAPWYSYRNSIKEVMIGDGVTSIGDSAFPYCPSLTSLTIGNSVTSIGVCAFCGCESLTSLTIGNSVTSIGRSAFENCTGLMSVTIGNGVTSIGDYVFRCCYGLTSVTMGNSVTSIGERAFSECRSLTSVTIPDSVTSIGDETFTYCTSLTGIWVSEANEYYSSDGSGVLFNKDKTTMIQAPGALSGAYTIPDSVTSIGDYAFFYCASLASVTIPDSVTSISVGAFSNCKSLASVTIPDSVTSIGEWAFEYCTSLTSVTIPDSVTGISNSAFYQCHSLTSVTIPESVTSIGVGAFSCCYNLTSVTIPDSVTSIGDRAFDFCDSLTSVMIPASVTSIGTCTFYCCRGLTSVTIPASVTSIGDYAFYECTSLSDVYYCGTEEMWNNIVIEGWNYDLLNATIHFNNTTDEEKCTHSNTTVRNAKAATCTEAGYTGDTYCTDCGVLVSSGTTISALGHNFAGGTCTRCEANDPDWDDNSNVPTTNPFGDVKTSDYFYTPVLWAVEKGITNGTSATKFSPEDPCTRGQIVTFLWRACGSPEPTSNSNPFTDVKTSDYYYKAVIWAVEKGITTGVSATKFGPNEACTRGQVATFLWRAQGKPAPTSSNNPFKDVKVGDYYYEAVLWAAENNVTQGTGAGKFSPNDSCTRGQIVTFLYRAIAQ